MPVILINFDGCLKLSVFYVKISKVIFKHAPYRLYCPVRPIIIVHLHDFHHVCCFRVIRVILACIWIQCIFNGLSVYRGHVIESFELYILCVVVYMCSLHVLVFVSLCVNTHLT